MGKLQKNINNLLEEMGKCIGKENINIVEICESSFLPNLSKEEKKDYKDLKRIFLKLKEEIEKKSGELTIAKKIREEIKKTGENRPLTDREEIIRKNLILVIDKQPLIIKVLQKMQEKKIKLNEIYPNFDKYILSNFYRTICELSLRLFTDVLLLIIKFKISQLEEDKKTENKEKILKLEKKMNAILNDLIGLDDLKNILGSFDKMLDKKLGLTQIIDKYFLYEEGKGFSLRNKIAHEKILFDEINNNYVLDQIKKVNRFNTAFIMVFYFSEVILKERDIDLSKQIFGN